MLQETPEAKYRLTIDGEDPIHVSGVACVVANAGTVGVGRLTLAPSVDVNDGRLDLFILKKANIEGIVQLASKMMGLDQIRREDTEQAALRRSGGAAPCVRRRRRGREHSSTGERRAGGPESRGVDRRGQPRATLVTEGITA